MKKKLILTGAAVLVVLVAGTTALTLRVAQMTAGESSEVTHAGTAGAINLGEPFPGDLKVKDSSGAEVSLSEFLDNDHFTAFVFHHPDCPCAANCAGLIGEMTKAGYDDVRVVGIMAEGMEDPRVMAALDEQLTDKTVTFPVYFDDGQAVMHALGATRTPELWLVDKKGIVRFWGAPENTLFPGSPGHRYYLKEAVDALRAGKTPEIESAKPIGCLIGG